MVLYQTKLSLVNNNEFRVRYVFLDRDDQIGPLVANKSVGLSFEEVAPREISLSVYTVALNQKLIKNNWYIVKAMSILE